MHKTYPHLLLLRLFVVACTVYYSGKRKTFNSLLIHKTADVGLYRLGLGQINFFVYMFHNVW